MLRRALMAEGGGPTPPFAFNSADKVATVTLSNSDRTASRTSGTGHDHATCLPTKNSGKRIFEFLIDSMPAATGNIAVGLAAAPGTAMTASGSYPAVESGGMWWVRKASANSRFYYTNAGGSGYDTLSTTTQSFSTGDIITFTVDFSTKEMNVYRNGTLIHTKTVTNINTGTYAYAPCVKLWGNGSGVGNVASVTCQTTITYPVSGFTAWA